MHIRQKDPNHNWTDPAEIEAIITRLERSLSGTGIDRTINKSISAPEVTRSILSAHSSFFLGSVFGNGRCGKQSQRFYERRMLFV